MLSKIIMPSGGQTTNESLIVKWRRKVGEKVERGDVLFEIETDKAVMEIESFAEGKLLGIKYPEGAYATTGETVAYVGGEDDKLPDGFGDAADKGDGEYQPIIKKEKEAVAEEQISAAGKAALCMSDTAASPAARRLARDGKIALEDIARSTSANPLKRADVERYIKEGAKQAAQDYYLVDVSNMRKVIADRMVQSAATAPHFNVTVEIDMSGAMELRQMLNEYLKDSGIKVSFNDIIIKCISKAIEKHPMINSTYNADKIKVYKDVNFGLAVGLENGLVVPVVRQANKKTIAEIARENAENIKKAKNNKLQVSDMSGGTITLSNLGMYGVDCFTAIINQPESCILAVGGIIEKPVVLKGEIVPGHRMSITASFDHRVIDGAAGAAFLRDAKELLEKPQLLLI